MSFGVVAAIRRSKFRVFPSSPLFLSRILPSIIFSSDSSSSFQPPQSLFFFLTGSNGGLNRSVSLPRWSCRCYHDGRPRGPLWRSKKIIGKEALFVILCLKRFKDDQEKLDKFIKTHVLRLLKLDLIAVLSELQRQEEVSLALLKMDDATQLWEIMRKEGLFPDSQTYTEVIRGFLRCGSPADAMNIYEDMKNSPDPPEELPFRILLKGLLPHPLLRNRVKQDFEEIFPDSHMYDPPEEIFGLR
ncbi:protein THYLAKOID ASSEMBLY 8-like, chloroplastic isoform X2 [Diospyros lotus]|uniref:protein THYLAKOID ASSEMBLY 8-like, chloroplastic isoform X2 n=1 Tax=Diospyros lotus TaxID=55363 RepID=UPI00224DB516|nr:protein THYLAKOID ASSEMBLY 8-like, chloroplastic isoform X2 [Diospyros lotus]